VVQLHAHPSDCAQRPGPQRPGAQAEQIPAATHALCRWAGA
jgi:hypothetical protein